jgi:hypothetical protein
MPVWVFARWEVGGSYADEAPGLGFGHRAEVIAAQRAQLLKVGPKGVRWVARASG